MRAYALALFIAVTVSAAAAHAEEKKPEKKAEEGDVSLDLDLDAPPAYVPVNGLDLDIDAPPAGAPVPPKPVPPPIEEALPPPPVPEPAPLPVVTVRRVEPPPPPKPVPEAPAADPMPAPGAKPWAFSAGLLGSVGGMSASTPKGLSVSDMGSAVAGGVFVAEWSRWEGRLSLEHVFQDRWLAANVRSDGAWGSTLHVGRWLWSPVQGVLLGVLVGGSYRAHGAPDGAWWASRGPAPSEWRVEAVPSAVWRVVERLDVALSLPVGYGFGTVDARDWRNFGGAFASFQCAVRYAFST